MMKIIRNSVKSNIITFIILFLFSCNNNSIDNISYYKEKKTDGNIINYYAVNMIKNKNITKVITLRYSDYKEAITDTLTEFYRIKNEEVYKLSNQNDKKGNLYLTTKSSNCVTYNYSDSILNYLLVSRHCFIGTKICNTSIGAIETNVFIKKVGQNDDIISKVYYDINFKLIKEEYLEGYITPYYIEITDSIPDNFRFLINSRNIVSN
ncbi:MAG: hypothetical protein Q4G63_13015 [Bacteroidia bacterium]|nr:hypothetical protein [Bacteroidia bacterium]